MKMFQFDQGHHINLAHVTDVEFNECFADGMPAPIDLKDPPKDENGCLIMWRVFVEMTTGYPRQRFFWDKTEAQNFHARLLGALKDV